MPTPSPRYAGNPALVALGAAIRRTRLERGVSQEDLAHKSVIDRAYMSSIERGKQNPGVISVVDIASALNITVAELMEKAGL